MKAQVSLAKDTLDDAVRRFAPAALDKPIFINSVPKSGTHLLRNIMRMFVPVDQHYFAEFVQWPNFFDHLAAFDPARPYLSCGHLLFTDASAIETAHCRRVLLVRDPFSWVLARARFFLSEQFSGNLDFIKQGRLALADLLNLMIFGIHDKVPGLMEQYRYNALAWIGTGALLVRYEDLVHQIGAIDTDDAEAWFADLFRHCSISMPSDWRERVVTGADRSQSGTARENLVLPEYPIPDELPDIQKKVVEAAAPGLRAALGYH